MVVNPLSTDARLVAVTISSPRGISRGYLSALGAAAILSTTAIFIRHLTLRYEVPPLVLAFWRDLFVAATLLPILAMRNFRGLRVSRSNLIYLAAYGVVLALFNALWTVSVALNGAAIATVLVYTSAGFTAVLGWLLLHESLKLPGVIAVMISLGGCALVTGALSPLLGGELLSGGLAGIATGVLSGLGYAGYTLMGRSAARRGLSPWTILFYSFAFAALFLLPFTGGTGGVVGTSGLFWLGAETTGWLLLFLLAAGPTVGGFGLYMISLRRLRSTVANLVVMLEPVFTAWIAWVLLGEQLSRIQIAGSLMILTAILVLRLEEGDSAKLSRHAAGIAHEGAPGIPAENVKGASC